MAGSSARESQLRSWVPIVQLFIGKYPFDSFFLVFMEIIFCCLCKMWNFSSRNSSSSDRIHSKSTSPTSSTMSWNPFVSLSKSNMTLKKIQPVESIKSINLNEKNAIVASGEQVKRGKSSYGETRRSIGSLEDLQMKGTPAIGIINKLFIKSSHGKSDPSSGEKVKVPNLNSKSSEERKQVQSGMKTKSKDFSQRSIFLAAHRDLDYLKGKKSNQSLEFRDKHK